MCKIGDIIIVNGYKDNGNTIPSHSFVVVSDENGKIQGLSYDFVANVLLLLIHIIIEMDL